MKLKDSAKLALEKANRGDYVHMQNLVTKLVEGRTSLHGQPVVFDYAGLCLFFKRTTGIEANDLEVILYECDLLTHLTQ